jgi:hypothetical protein
MSSSCGLSEPLTPRGPHHTHTQALATPLWQGGVALAGALMLLLLYGRLRRSPDMFKGI